MFGVVGGVEHEYVSVYLMKGTWLNVFNPKVLVLPPPFPALRKRSRVQALGKGERGPLTRVSPLPLVDCISFTGPSPPPPCIIRVCNPHLTDPKNRTIDFRSRGRKPSSKKRDRGRALGGRDALASGEYRMGVVEEGTFLHPLGRLCSHPPTPECWDR